MGAEAAEDSSRFICNLLRSLYLFSNKSAHKWKSAEHRGFEQGLAQSIFIENAENLPELFATSQLVTNKTSYREQSWKSMDCINFKEIKSTLIEFLFK